MPAAMRAGAVAAVRAAAMAAVSPAAFGIGKGWCEQRRQQQCPSYSSDGFHRHSPPRLMAVILIITAVSKPAAYLTPPQIATAYACGSCDGS